MFVFLLSALSLVIASPFTSILFYKVLLCNILETSQKNYPVNTAASHRFLPLRHFLREREISAFWTKKFYADDAHLSKTGQRLYDWSMHNNVVCE